MTTLAERIQAEGTALPEQVSEDGTALNTLEGMSEFVSGWMVRVLELRSQIHVEQLAPAAATEQLQVESAALARELNGQGESHPHTPWFSTQYLGTYLQTHCGIAGGAEYAAQVRLLRLAAQVQSIAAEGEAGELENYQAQYLFDQARSKAVADLLGVPLPVLEPTSPEPVPLFLED